MYWLGVDLGTTYTGAAIKRGETCRMVSIGASGATIPSIVYVGEDGAVVTGTAAQRRAIVNPARVAREFKRRFGDTVPLLLGGTPLSAEQLTARLLRWVIDEVTKLEGEAPAGIAITHPANWREYKLELLQQAIRLADAGPCTLLTEPEAAAIHYAASERLEIGETIVVYDLGGGTFDVSVLEMGADGFVIRGQPEGIERLGGLDFDAAVLDHVLSEIEIDRSTIDSDDPDWEAAIARLKIECTAAKEALSSDTVAVIEAFLPTGRTAVELTRSEFERMIRPTVNDTLGALRRAIQSAALDPSAIHAFLLIGGSSRIPLIASLVAETFDRPTALDAHPKHSVALGAAEFAAGIVRPAAPPGHVFAEIASPDPVPDVAEHVSQTLDLTTEVTAALDTVSTLALEHDRSDLAERLQTDRSLIEVKRARVVVCGDFKQGKSSLVNELAETMLCPTDADFATAVPTTLRYGRELRIRVYRETDENGEAPDLEEIRQDQLVDYVTESGNRPPEADRIRSCEITVPTEWMQLGVEIVDLPGAGGLDSPHGIRATTELMAADAAIFVSDASQELTQPELDFLRTALRHCPNSIFVMSKIDLYPAWKRIRDLNTGHLARANLEIPIVPVSSALVGLARRLGDDSFVAESGIAELIDVLSKRIVAPVRDSMLNDVSKTMLECTGQLKAVVLAEIESVNPLGVEQLIQQLDRSLDRALDLRIDSAEWRRALEDGVVDLRRAAEDHLDGLIRGITAEAHAALEESDPTEIWDDYQSWLRREASRSVAATYESLTNQSAALSERVAALMASAEDGVLLGGTDGQASPWLGALSMAELARKTNGPARDIEIISGGWVAADPLVAVGGMIPGLGPFSLAIGAIAVLVYGRRASRKRKANILDQNREQARSQTEDFLDESRALVLREIDRYLSGLYRQLRDIALRRATEVERSIEEALERARRNAGQEQELLDSRLVELQQELVAIEQSETMLRSFMIGTRELARV